VSAVVEDRSLGQLLGDLVTETRTLVRQELELAKTEVTQKASYVGRNAAFAAAGGLVIIAGFLTLIAALVIVLGHKVGYGTAAFIVGIVVAGIGAALTMKGINAIKSMPVAPQQTQAQLQETKQWLTQQTK
jgi:hypothetical protein